MFAPVGVYPLSAGTVEVRVMCAIGVMGFVVRRYDVPIARVILGVILGPLMESQGAARSSDRAATSACWRAGR